MAKFPPGVFVDPNPQYNYEDWIDSWAFDRGRRHALYAEVHLEDKTEVGCGCSVDNICNACLPSAANEAEMNDRQSDSFMSETRHWDDDDEYGPKFNYWPSFEEHVAKGLESGVQERLLKKYGEKLLFLKQMGADRYAARGKKRSGS